jgi:D-arabinose 5-phosphate isomerase GutQ
MSRGDFGVKRKGCRHGIGKSAIIDNKIVATMNSTGMPALFMHVADAVHGDLGMIQNDALLEEIIIEISGKRLGATAVLDSYSKLMGIITDGDLRRML